MSYQLAMDSDGRLFVATYGPGCPEWEPAPLTECGMTEYPAIPATEWQAPRPDWAADFYITTFEKLLAVCMAA